MTAPATHYPGPDPFTAAEQARVTAIVARVQALDIVFGATETRRQTKLDIEMDLAAVHAACPLDLDKLAEFADADFCHDIGLIRRHLDRTTGQLPDWFAPRCIRSSRRAIDGKVGPADRR